MRQCLPLAIISVLLGALVARAQTNYDTSPNGQTGAQVYGSYFATDIDTVGINNGNLHLAIPLFSLPGRELPYGLSLSYNGQKWESDSIAYTSVGRYTGGWVKSNVFGQAPSFFADTNGCYVYWIDGSGAKHKYVPQTTDTWCAENLLPADWNNHTLKSLDSDGSTLWTGQYQTDGTDAARINFKNGHVRYFRTAHSSIGYDYVTPNGNYSIKTTNESGLPTQDTLARSAGYSCSTGCGTGTWIETYTVNDSTGTAQTYVLSWTKATSFTVGGTTTNFVDPFLSNHPAVTMIMLNAITLPNSKTYTFEYANIHGMLTKVTLPSGAYIRYTYATNNNIMYYVSPALERVSERRVSVDGTTGGEKLWQYATTNGTYWQITVTSPENDKVVHYFNPQGQEAITEWQTSASVVLKKVENTWAQNYVLWNGQADTPRVTTSKTYLNGTLSATKDMTYDTTNQNLLQEKLTEGTGAAGQVKNQKDITYTTITGNYTVATQETLTAIDPVSGNFVLQGKTVYAYDEYTLTARSGVPNHTGNTSPTNRGNLTSITQYKDSSNAVTEHRKYDSVGNVVEHIDPLTHSTLTSFDDNFCTLTPPNYDTCSNTAGHSTYAYPKQVTNALSQSKLTKFDYNTGLPTVVTNLRGYDSRSTYDLMNRVTSVTEPNGKKTTYSYDDTNRITTKEVTVDSAGNKGHVETSFDKLYRVTETRTNDPEGVIAIDTTYDGKGRKSQVSNPYRLSSETPVQTTTTYDATDRPVQVQAADASTVSYAYAFNQTTVTDEAGNQRRYTYNPLGQMTKVEEPNRTLLYNTPLITTYTYYGFGPLYQSGQSGQWRTFGYNWLSQMTAQTLPESGTTSLTYDAAGRLYTKTDARNVTTTFSYDTINRPTGKTYSDSTSAVSWGYDANGYTGLQTSMSDAVGSISYTYDIMDRPTQESRTLTGVSGTFPTSYGYNVKGDITQLTYPSGRVVNFNYAIGGGCCNSRLASVVDQSTGATLANAMTFNAAGEPLTRTLNPGSNAITETFQYNTRHQLTQIADSMGSMSLMNFTYDYGTSSTNTGRVLSRTDAIQAEHSQTYTYDAIYRLTQVLSADKTWDIVWTFDNWGNRTNQTPQGLASPKVGAQTSGYNNNRNTSFNYDAVGNQTNDGLHNYTFNAENQITQMDGGTATYAYDGNGRRIKKSFNGETTYTFYGPGGTLCEFSTSAGTSTATSASTNDHQTFRTSDKLGSAVLLIASYGIVVENNRTLPYGESWLTDANSVNDKKFTTYQRDQESGLDYAMNRFYENTGGRMRSADQGRFDLFIPLSLNRYVYGMDDPINHSDLDGNDPNNCNPHPDPDGLTTCEGTTPPAPPSITLGDMVLISSSPWTAAIAEVVGRSAFERKLKAKLDQALKKLVKPSQDCTALFKGIGVDDPRIVAQVVQSQVWEDGTKAATTLTSAMGRVVKGMEDWTVADLFNTGPAPLPSQTRIDGFSPEGGTIYVRPSAVTWELMVHEALHQMGKGFDDMTIMVNMGKMYGEDPNKGGVVPDPNNSQQISDKIKEKCN